MEQLAAYKARGTFFCVGDNVRKHPEIVEELRKQGHTLGNHTFHHLKGWRHSVGNYVQDVQQCADILPTRLFRPPYGKITRKQLKALRNDYSIIMWSLLSRDFDQDLNVAESLEALKIYTVPGSIVVFHDSIKAEKTLNNCCRLTWSSAKSGVLIFIPCKHDLAEYSCVDYPGPFFRVAFPDLPFFMEEKTCGITQRLSA